MDRRYIDQHNVVERYVLHQLSEDELVAFEDAFVLDEELQREIDDAEALIYALKTHEKRKKKSSDQGATAHLTELKVANSPPESAGKPGLLPWSLAANVLLMLGGVFLVFGGPKAPNAEIPLSVVNPVNISFEHVRSAAANMPVLEATNDWVSLRVSGAVFSGNPERLEIKNSEGDSVVTEASIRFDPFSPWIDWMILGSKLPPGRYSLEIESIDADNDALTATVPFHVCESISTDCIYQ